MAPKIDAHVLVYGSMFFFTSAAALGYQKAFTKPPEVLEAELREKYPDLIKRSEDQKVHMQAFFDKMKNRDPSLDADFDAVLKGGYVDVKRTGLYDKAKEEERNMNIKGTETKQQARVREKREEKLKGAEIVKGEVTEEAPKRRSWVQFLTFG